MHIEIIHYLETQLSQRLEKLWRVFSWCSSVLISIAGAVIVLPKTHGVIFSFRDDVLVSILTIVVTTFAYLWIMENIRFEKRLRDELDALIEKEYGYSQLKTLRPDKATFGYSTAVISLGLVTLLAILLV
jgi:membrane protein YdbS with pleckstrin-like domain